MSVLDEVVGMFETGEVRASRKGGSVKIVRDGYAFMIVNWIGGDVFVITRRIMGEWVAFECGRDEVTVFVDGWMM